MTNLLAVKYRQDVIKNVSEVIRAGLRLLEDEESKVVALRAAIQKGLDSPLVENFDFKENLKKLKDEKK